MKLPVRISKILLVLAGIICLLPFVNAGEALVLGIILALLAGNPFRDKTANLTKHLLSISVIGLGAGMDLIAVAKTGIQGIGYTAVSITLVIAFGLFLGRLLKADREPSALITIGTAICGGSAIAAVAPVMNAKPHNISVAIAVVFVLNAAALLIFPAIGHHFHLSEQQFGLWSALAIHDTSSVVGAGAIYGPLALEVGTTVKLARALWIVPLVFIVQAWYNRMAGASETAETNGRPKYPWFILGFLLTAALVTFFPVFQTAGHWVEFCARRLLVLTLFLIGTNLTKDALRAVGMKPLLQGALLWVAVSISALAAIKTGLLY